MKKLIVVAIAVATAFSSCGTGGGSIKTDTDSVAYAIGVDLGLQIKQSDSTLNPNLIAKGIIDVFKGKNKIDRDSSVAIQREYFTVKLPAKKKAAQEKYLESIAKANSNIVKTESGLLYEVVMPGDEAVKATKDTDKVVVKYKGMLKGGETFDENENFETQLNHVIRGWTEGMKLVGKGGKVNLWIPSDLAYGDFGQPYARVPIGPSEPLLFEVEVLDVIPTEVPVEEAN